MYFFVLLVRITKNKVKFLTLKESLVDTFIFTVVQIAYLFLIKKIRYNSTISILDLLSSLLFFLVTFLTFYRPLARNMINPRRVRKTFQFKKDINDSQIHGRALCEQYFEYNTKLYNLEEFFVNRAIFYSDFNEIFLVNHYKNWTCFEVKDIIDKTEFLAIQAAMIKNKFNIDLIESCNIIFEKNFAISSGNEYPNICIEEYLSCNKETDVQFNSDTHETQKIVVGDDIPEGYIKFASLSSNSFIRIKYADDLVDNRIKRIKGEKEIELKNNDIVYLYDCYVVGLNDNINREYIQDHSYIPNESENDFKTENNNLEELKRIKHNAVDVDLIINRISKIAVIFVVILIVVASVFKSLNSNIEDNSLLSNETVTSYRDTYVLQPVEKPLSGTVLSGNKYYNQSEITITTSESESCVVKLKSTSGATRISFFVRAGETVTVGVPSEELIVYFAIGENWYGQENLFGSETSYSKDAGICDFANNTYSYKLYPVSYGNFRETPIDEDEFN